MTRPTHNSSKVSSKVHLGNANRVLRKDILKPLSIATCNLTHKAAKIPQVKLNIRKPSKNQPSTLSPNVIKSLCLNTHKQPSPVTTCKPSCSVTKLSHLKAYNTAHQKFHHGCGVDTNNVSANHLHYKLNHLSRQEIFNFVFILSEFLLLLIFLRNNFDFICKDKQVSFVKMHPTISSEYIFCWK